MQTSAEIARRRPCLTWLSSCDDRPSTGKGGSFNQASPWETCLLQLCPHRSEREFDTEHFLDALATPSCCADKVDLASGQVRVAAGIPLKKHDDGSPSSWFLTKPCAWLVDLSLHGVAEPCDTPRASPRSMRATVTQPPCKKSAVRNLMYLGLRLFESDAVVLRPNRTWELGGTNRACQSLGLSCTKEPSRRHAGNRHALTEMLS